MSNDGTLPQEIITDVLSRLPVKSLGRFKSVSRSWKTLISDPHFAKMHVNRTNTQNPKNLARKIILFSSSQNLYSVDFADVIPTATKLDFPTVEQQADFKLVRVWGSCNGLLLVSGTGNSNFLLNPSTREVKKLRTRPSLLDLFAGFFFVYGVGYDSRMDDYKVVMFSCAIMGDTTTIDVYSLKNDAWRKIEQDLPYMLTLTSGILFNGCLHCFCWTDDSFAIVAFDFSDEYCKEVPLPAALVTSKFGCFDDLTVLGDFLCLSFFREPSKKLEVWMMKEYGVRESWNKIMIEMPGQFVLRCLCLLAEDDFLLKSYGLIVDRVKREKLVVYDPKKETMRDMVFSGIPSQFKFGGTYVDSLVSPHNG